MKTKTPPKSSFPNYTDEKTELKTNLLKKSLCTLPKNTERTFLPEVSDFREGLIRSMDKKWVNGTKLRYYFLTGRRLGTSNAQKNIVREAFQIWKDLEIGLSFEEVQNIGEAEIRIGFMRGDGAWSYVGRDALHIPGQYERTMNFGWQLSGGEGLDTALHEIGHALGFHHEHQNPFSGIVWNEEAVYDLLAQPPNNWSRARTFHNILRKLDRNEVEGSEWDPNSIMHYPFPAGIILQPAQYQNIGIQPAGGLSPKDIEMVKRFYPPLEEETEKTLIPFDSKILNLEPAEQINFVIEPSETREYTIQTFGESDTVMVLFENRDGELRFLQGDDDSGTHLNARIRTRLYVGSKYILRIRLYLNYATGRTAVMLW